MYCRTCGNKVNDNAEICVKCGVRKNVGTDFCQVCGTRTLAGMTSCKKCGAKLITAMSSAQVKKKAVSKGRRILGTTILVLGVILLIVTAVHIFMGVVEDNSYSSMQSFIYAGRTSTLGVIFTICGLRLRKTKK